MNFINKYSSQSYKPNYYYTEEFMEDGEAVVYAIGESSELPLITKIDKGGDLVWEKTFQVNRVQAVLAFKKIIQIGSQNVVQNPGAGDVKGGGGGGAAAEYVLYATDSSNHWLQGINRYGAVVWSFQVPWTNHSVTFYLEPCIGQNAFYIVISNTANSAGTSRPFIAKFDSAGQLLASQAVSYQSGSFIINAISAHSNGVTLAGSYISTDTKGFIADFNSSLSFNLALSISQPLGIIQDVLCVGTNRFVLSGYLSALGNLFVAEINYTLSTQFMYSFPGTTDQLSKLCKGTAAYYFLQYTGQGGNIIKLDTMLLPLWTKTLDFGVGSTSNGLNLLRYNAEVAYLSFIANDSVNEDVVVHADPEMNTCKTLVLSDPDISTINLIAQSVTVTVIDSLVSPQVTSISVTDYSIEKTVYCGGGIEIGLDPSASLQSPNFYLQSTGSTGADGSATGIHLRWIFSGALGEKHLPKGNLASSGYHFNKPNDFVSVYRAPYVKAQTTLNLANIPYLVDDTNKVWLYRVGNKVFYVYFRNTAKYTLTRLTYNPMISPLDFIVAYGNEIIEIENKKELFFAAQLLVQVNAQNATVKTETLSVPENALAVSRTISSRKTYASTEFGNIRLVCENGRSIRIKPANCTVTSIKFEFYGDFILGANNRSSWTFIDNYALVLDNATAFSRLEPAANLIDSKWLRYNDKACVNINNYKDKWNGPRESWDRNIQMVVDKYIDLSNAQNNPKALENVPLQSGGNGVGDTLEVSNLDLLNMAAYDYHVARMLGLGTLDISNEVLNGQYIYIAKYTTTADLEDGGGARTVNHLSMSIPTSVNDERLPLAVDLKEVKPGAFWGTESPEPVNLTDENGYSHDGRVRYVTLYAEDLPADETNKPFYYTNRQFNLAEFTYPVYAGVEYKKNTDTEWVKPELPNDPKYQNKVSPGDTPHNETIPLVLPESQKPLFIHQQRMSGTHYYSSYGINWFSRAASSSQILSILTTISPVNPLKPPTNINALLVRQESPLLLTSQQEQTRFNAIVANQDHTLIRVSFDYHSFHELLDYKVPVGANVNDPNIIPADSSEIFADKVELFFRNQVPGNVSGKALTVSDHPANHILSVIQTGQYIQSSTGDILIPDIPTASVANYIGGVFIMGSQQYIIQQIVLPTGTMTGPEFTVFKKEISNGIVTNEIPSPNAQNLQAPEINPDGLFMAVENMQNPSSWGTPNPLTLKVNIGQGWQVNRELITIVNDDGSSEQHLEKARGIWDAAVIETVNEPVELPGGGSGTAHKGMYKFTFQNVVLAQHGQYSANGVSVEWYQGIIRVHTNANPNSSRKVLKVARIENVATANKLVLYAFDAAFSSDPAYDHIQTGNVNVNFYPGYKVYLYNDAAAGLTYPDILPASGEGVHYSIFGLRSHDDGGNFNSRISTPQLMFAQEQVEALIPEQPLGPLYATRPDFFGRSTYSFTTKYVHKPHGVLFYRSNDEALLNALYEQTTVAQIKDHLKLLGGNNETFFTNRWHNFLDFTALAQDGDYKAFPPNDPANGYKFPNPDRQDLFDWANQILTKLALPLITETPGTLAAGNSKIRDFVKGAVYNAFVPLTAVPIIYQHINSGAYQPVAKKQVIRDRNGNVLSPTDPEFDMAPMMKITGGSGNETSFTDFTLDGTSNNIYFYGVRELNTQMKMSDFSPFLGPVKLVNTNPPEAPEVKRIMPVLENQIAGITPHVQLEINAYPEIQQVKKITVYRAMTVLDAQSVRTMVPVKIIDLDAEGIITNSIWQVEDAFEDLTELPYSDGLYYRLTVSRKIEYDDKDGNVLTEYAPSQPSKLVATMMVEAYNPIAPIVTYVADPINPQGELHHVKLQWDKAAYKAKYHIYKMNSSGNWVKIYDISSNAAQILLPLENTDLQTDIIQTLDGNGNKMYTHFKVVAENTSGMLSLEENILTIPGA